MKNFKVSGWTTAFVKTYVEVEAKTKEEAIKTAETAGQEIVANCGGHNDLCFDNFECLNIEDVVELDEWGDEINE